MHRAAIGRGDLLRALVDQERHGQPAVALAELGALLGYELQESVVDRVRSVEGVKRVSGQASSRSSRSKVVAGGTPFWQPRELVWRDDESQGRITRVKSEQKAVDVGMDADAGERAEMAAIAPPSTPLLSSRRRLVPMLERALVGERPGDDVDVNELVLRMGRGEHLHEIPRLRRHAWPTLVVLVDRDFALVPFWADQEQLCRWLVRVIGESALVIRVVDEHGPEARVFDPAGRRVPPLDGSLAGVPVLALTDLGWYRGPTHQRAWLRLGRRLRRAGERIHALVPVPVARWTQALSRVWSPMPWERPSVEYGTASEPRGRVERLLRMAAFAHRLDPGLLRTLRLALPRDQADVGTEADAWLHEHMAAWFPSATVVRAERAEALRAAISMEDAERARDALREWHWHRDRKPELWHTEVLTLDHAKPGAVDPQDRVKAEAFVERLGARVEAARRAGERPPEGLRGWLEYVKAHAPRQLWDPTRTDPKDGTTGRGKVGRGLQRAWWATHGKGEPPPYADPALRILDEDQRTRSTRNIELWQVGRRIGPRPEFDETGSPLAVIAVADERVYVVEAGGKSREVLVDAPVWIEGRPAEQVEIRTDQMTLRIDVLDACEKNRGTLDSRGKRRESIPTAEASGTPTGMLLDPELAAYRLMHVARLSPIERDVARMVLMGLRDVEIAEKLGQSERTAKRYVGRVLEKVGVTNRSSLWGVLHVGSVSSPKTKASGMPTPMVLDPEVGADRLMHVVRLSLIERDVARMVLMGLPDIEIAEKLGQSERTARRYVDRVLGKAGVQNRGGLWGVLYADSVAAPASQQLLFDSEVDLDQTVKTCAWASATGRDRFGLWAEMKVGEVRYRMRWISPGRFVMGSPEDEPGRQSWEGPQHEVTITRGFWLGETPVTQALWKVVTGESPSHFHGSDRPVEGVSWEDCQDRMIDRLNEAIGVDDGIFRLPTEAEWEYACRAGTSTATYAGPIEIRGENDAPVLDEIAWYSGNSGVEFDFEDGVDSSGWPNKQYPHIRAGTRRVGQKQPNSWGLYDMLGNVWEWCQDSWGFGIGYGSRERQKDPSGPVSGMVRVVRGGSWVGEARGVRAAFRLGSPPSDRAFGLGLRLARDQVPVLEDERVAPGPDLPRPRQRSVR